MSDAAVPGLLKTLGINALRYPGGIDADAFHWASPPSGNVTFDQFMTLANSSGASPVITVNYRSNSSGASPGDPNEAAGWVAYSKSKGYGVKYWEIGNEEWGYGYGDGSAANPNSINNPTYYGTAVVSYATAMKAQDSTIKIGAVLTNPGQYPDNYSPDWNSSVLAQCGTKIDFVILHYYPEDAQTPSDAGLLGAAAPQIPLLVARTRALINRYCGANAPNVQIFITETNCFASADGKHITNLVNSLFVADETQTWLENGVANVDVWNLHGGMAVSFDPMSGYPTVITNAADPSLYGNNLYDDSGILSWTIYAGYLPYSPYTYIQEPTTDTPLPTYYGEQMVGILGGPGDYMVSSTSDQSLVSTHAIRNKNGNLSVMLVNKSPSTTYTANVTVKGYTSSWTKTSTTSLYGEASSAVTSTSGTGGSTFSQSLPPYSITTVVLSAVPSSPIFLTSVTPAVTTVAPGATATMTAAVKDSGTALSGATVKVYAYDLSGTQVGSTTFTGQSWAAGATKNFTYPLTAPSTLSTYTLSVKVTDSTGNTQYYSGSSLASIQVTSNGTAPTSPGFSEVATFSPTTVTEGQTAILTLQITDTGAAVTNATVVGGTYIGSSNQSLPGTLHQNWVYGQTNTYTYTWTAPNTPGTYSLQAGVLSPDSAVQYSGYNGLITQVNVVAPTSSPTFSFSAKANPITIAPGAASTISASITDTGGALSNSVAEVEIFNAGGQEIAGQHTPNQNWYNGTTNNYTYTWTAPSTPGVYNVNLGVVSADGSDVYAYNGPYAQITVALPSLAISNFGFEAPSIPNGQFQYSPSGASWTFTSDTGIASNGSPFNNPTAPEGTQVGIVQETGSISQTLTSTAAGTWTVTVSAAQRPGSSQTVNVLLDGSQIGTITASSASFATYSVTTPSPLSAGSHILEFQGTTTADNTEFLDNVQVTLK